MPYKSARRGRNRKPALNKYVRNAASVASTAYTALKVAQGVAALVNVEKKRIDSFVNDTPDNTGSIALISGVIEGDDNNMRNGRSIKATSLAIRGTMTLNSGGGAITTCARILTFIDWSSNGVAPTIAEVLQTSDLDSFMNVDHVGKNGRFKILRDQYVCLSNSGNQEYHYEDYIKLGHHIRYQGTTGAIGDAAQGHIFVLTISNQPIASAPGFPYKTRVRFIDN